MLSNAVSVAGSFVALLRSRRR